MAAGRIIGHTIRGSSVQGLRPAVRVMRYASAPLQPIGHRASIFDA